MNQYIENYQSELESVINYFKKEINNIRTGRANPNILEGVIVDAYGARTPINALANINVADGQSMVVAPYDKNVIKEIEKSIVNADLGLGVVNEGDRLRLTVAKMTEENRRELVKKLNEQMEESRISLRKIREGIKSDIEKAGKDKEISEDDKFRFIKELDEEIGQKNDEIKAIRDKKEQEIMTI